MNSNVLACNHKHTVVMVGKDEHDEELRVHVCDDCSKLPYLSGFKMEVIC